MHREHRGIQQQFVFDQVADIERLVGPQYQLEFLIRIARRFADLKVDVGRDFRLERRQTALALTGDSNMQPPDDMWTPPLGLRELEMETNRPEDRIRGTQAPQATCRDFAVQGHALLSQAFGVYQIWKLARHWAREYTGTANAGKSPGLRKFAFFIHMPDPTLILASSSPYRRALLSRLGVSFAAVAPAVDETALPGESASLLAIRLARAKAVALAAAYPGHLIVGSDQAADLAGRLIGKPGTLAQAVMQLEAAAGRVVQFHTAVHLLNSGTGEARSALVTTEVAFRPLRRTQIDRYLAREPALDCAGSFRCEALGIALCERIVGEDPTALIGLPLMALTRLLADMGVDVLG